MNVGLHLPVPAPQAFELCSHKVVKTLSRDQNSVAIQVNIDGKWRLGSRNNKGEYSLFAFVRDEPMPNLEIVELDTILIATAEMLRSSHNWSV